MGHDRSEVASKWRRWQRRIQNRITTRLVLVCGAVIGVVLCLLLLAQPLRPAGWQTANSKAAMLDLFECFPRNGLLLVDPGVLARIRAQEGKPSLTLPANLNDGDTLELAMPAELWKSKDNEYAFSQLEFLDEQHSSSNQTAELDQDAYRQWLQSRWPVAAHAAASESFLAKIVKCGRFSVRAFLVESDELATGARSVHAVQAIDESLKSNPGANPGGFLQDWVGEIAGRQAKQNLFDDEGAAGPGFVEDEKPGVHVLPKFRRSVLAVLLDHTTSHAAAPHNGDKIAVGLSSDANHVRVIVYLIHRRGTDHALFARLMVPVNSAAENQLISRARHDFGLRYFVQQAEQAKLRGIPVAADDAFRMGNRPKINPLFIDGHAYLGYQQISLDTTDLAVVSRHVDGVRITHPLHISKFLDQLQHSRFVECDQARARRFMLDYGAAIEKFEDTAMETGRGMDRDEFRERSREMIDMVTAALSPLGVTWWLNSGTLLGWYRQCDVLAYGLDFDIGVPIEHFSEGMVDALVSHGFQLKHRLGLPSWGLEISFVYGKIKLDVFFYYREGDKMWNGGTQVRNGQKLKYTFPIIHPCWTEYLDRRVRVPCNTLAHVTSNYGPNWDKPKNVWKWRVDPPNVIDAGTWTADEMKEAVQIFIGGA
ncbi:fukutin like protein [Capsaspora owczarzaki ATCC 30864]|uniref:Fukutin like protein n=1 Tax=Capsaspora owczarzaki (strain ATCC 30864) TaxID=595528 RepID=A0A0D2U3P0_CAPO3|nr:fukutin like protein [Capsaspora owczarzaki ATCC 30864]KJE89831.1 fukutin like protein [Capsaspora owczarzaki ATCC 30864]|eukprot:XP_004349775.2 fukutin like protein [Capsaspora owczarzaki ATCC 30864]